MIVGDREWQQNTEPKKWRLRVRDAVRADYHVSHDEPQTVRFWRLSEWDQPAALSLSFASHLDLQQSVRRLKLERPELWRTLMIVDILRPFAPATVTSVPPECRRKTGIAKACRVLGLTPQGVAYRLEVGWALVTKWLLETEK